MVKEFHKLMSLKVITSTKLP